jgi:hypothetical protein
VSQVAARRAVAHALTVHIENEAVVGAHAHGIAGWRCVERERAAEVQHHRLAQRRNGMRDPGGVPLALRRVGLRVQLQTILGMGSSGSKGQSGNTEREFVSSHSS